MRIRSWVGSVGLVSTVAVLAIATPACGGGGGSDTEPPSNAAGHSGGGASGAGGSNGGNTAAGTGGGTASTCATDADCKASAPATMPAGCAAATCDPVARRCAFSAPDKDGDHHGDAKCVPVGAGLFQPGDDCDDTDANTYPGAWDGPAGDGHADTCDMKDEDCNGKVDDGHLKSGESCICKPNQQRPCETDAAGKALKFPSGTLQGVCKRGVETCTAGGVWPTTIDGQGCQGAIGVSVEICNGEDDDCNGVADDNPTDPVYWRYDGDDDLHAAKGWATVQSCAQDAPKTAPKECAQQHCPSDAQPTPGQCCAPGQTPGKDCCPLSGWKLATNAPDDDCNDADDAIHPGATEVCDGKDNDCSGAIDDGATGTTTWTRDFDGDGFVASGATVVKLCGNPGTVQSTTGLYTNCTPSSAACPTQWSESPKAGDDCNDLDATIHPGAWDGPMSGFGIKPPGLSVDYFADLNLSGVVAHVDGVQSLELVLGLQAPPGSAPTPRDFGARFTGTLVAPEDGTYTINTVNDDGVRVYVGGKAIINDWTPHSAAPNQADVVLVGGAPTPFVVEYFDSGGLATLEVGWKGPSFAQRPLTTWLTTSQGVHDAACDAIDQDCNGKIDDTVVEETGTTNTARCIAECVVGQAEPCGGNGNRGVCYNGLQSCQGDGTFAPECVGEALPKGVDTCGAQHIDNNCDGVDQCGCTDGTSSCGECNEGTRSCSGGNESACSFPNGQKGNACTDGSGCPSNFVCGGPNAVSCQHVASTCPQVGAVSACNRAGWGGTQKCDAQCNGYDPCTLTSDVYQVWVGTDPALGHGCGYDNGDTRWRTDKNAGGCVMQYGPYRTLPHGQYGANYYFHIPNDGGGGACIETKVTNAGTADPLPGQPNDQTQCFAPGDPTITSYFNIDADGQGIELYVVSAPQGGRQSSIEVVATELFCSGGNCKANSPP